VLSQRICQAFSSLLLSLLAVSACNQSSRSDIPKQNASVEAELLAIEELNQRAVDAVLAADVAATLSQWTDDFVMLGPEGPIIHGRDTIASTLEQTRQQGLSLEPLEYVAKFEEIKILGDYAYEWGTYRGKSRQPGRGVTVSYSGKLLRILQRQADGSWKIHRAISTSDPPSS
jgi:uncharacterized protein (TIGR02246 family)